MIYVVARDISARRQSETAMSRHEHFSTIVGETALIGAWYVELPGGSPIWSDEVCAIHDEPAGFQPTVDQAIAYYAPHDRQRLSERFAACCRDGTGFDEEFEVVTARGRHIWVRVIGQAVHDEAGCILRAQGSTQDITEQRRLRAEVSRLAERLTTTLESITDGFFTLDADWCFTYVNREAERLLQSAPGSLLGCNIWEAFPEAWGSRFDIEYRRAIDTGVAAHFEACNPRLDLWVEVHAYPSDEGLAVYFRDINQRKESERQLRILESSVASSINGVVICDARKPDLPIVYVNPAFERITGYAREEAVGATAASCRARTPSRVPPWRCGRASPTVAMCTSSSATIVVTAPPSGTTSISPRCVTRRAMSPTSSGCRTTSLPRRSTSHSSPTTPVTMH